MELMLEILQIGMLTSIPQIFAAITTLILGRICDHVVHREILNVTHARKFFTFMGKY